MVQMLKREWQPNDYPRISYSGLDEFSNVTIRMSEVLSMAAKFTIFVNNQEVSTDAHELTGAQIKDLANIPANYELFKVEGNTSVAVGNDQVVHIHEKEHFRAIPAGTFGI